MSKTIEQFNYRVIKMAKGDNLPFDPYVEIVLDHCSRNDDDTPIISPKLMTEEEIDWHIQQLKVDLDAIGKRAKAALLKAKAETKSIVQSRNSDWGTTKDGSLLRNP